MEPETIVSLITALAGIAVAFVALRKSSAERAALKAGATATLTDAASNLIDDLQAEVRRLRERIESLECKLLAQADIIREMQVKLEAADDRIAALEAENARLEAENKAWQARWEAGAARPIP